MESMPLLGPRGETAFNFDARSRRLIGAGRWGRPALSDRATARDRGAGLVLARAHHERSQNAQRVELVQAQNIALAVRHGTNERALRESVRRSHAADARCTRRRHRVAAESSREWPASVVRARITAEVGVVRDRCAANSTASRPGPASRQSGLRIA